MSTYKRLERIGAMGGSYQNLPKNLLTTQHTTLEAFEDATSWTEVSGAASIADDTTNFLFGTKSMRVVSDANTVATLDKTINWDLTNVQNIRLYLYTANTLNLSTIKLMLANDSGFSNFYQYSTTAYPQPYSNSGWTVINMPRASWTVGAGTPSWSSAFIRLRLRISPRTGETVDVSLDNLTGGVLGQGAVLFTYDDGNTSIYNSAFSYMRTQKVRGTFYNITDRIGTGGYCTAAQLQEMYASGWDIGNHTKTHAYWVTAGLTQGEIETELSEAKTALDALGFTRSSSHVAYPSGEYNAAGLAAMTAQGMLTGRTTQGNNYNDVLYPPSNYRLNIKYVYLATTLAVVKGWLDDAKAKGEIVVLMFHDLVASPVTENKWAISDHNAVVDYVKQIQLPAMTMSDLYNVQSNSIRIAK